MPEIDDFELFWNSYPPRKGDKAKQPAKVLFEKAVKSGIPPQDLIEAAKKYAASETANHNTPFIMQAQRWLRNKRWLDYQYEPTQAARDGVTQIFISEETPNWTAWQEYLRRTTGKGSPCVNFGWWFPSSWPPVESHP
jgi:hypothetical protein